MIYAAVAGFVGVLGRLYVWCALFRKQRPRPHCEILWHPMAPCSETMPEIIFTRHSHCAICRRLPDLDRRRRGTATATTTAQVERDWTAASRYGCSSPLAVPVPVPVPEPVPFTIVCN